MRPETEWSPPGRWQRLGNLSENLGADELGSHIDIGDLNPDNALTLALPRLARLLH